MTRADRDFLDTGGIEWDHASSTPTRRGSVTIDEDPPNGPWGYCKDARYLPTPEKIAEDCRWSAQWRRDLATTYRASGNAVAKYPQDAAEAMRQFALAAKLDVEAREFERQANAAERKE